MGHTYDLRKLRNQYLRKEYGISLADYERMEKAQGGKCLICQRVPRKHGPNRIGLVVDHDHRTGQVRGLLCSSCNVGIAAVDRHRDRAIAYLKLFVDTP